MILSNLGTITIGYSTVHPKRNRVQKDVYIKQEARINIELWNEKSFDNYKTIIYKLQNFLTFAVSEAVHPTKIVGYLPQEFGQPKKVEIFYALPEAPKFSGNITPSRMLFNFKDLETNFEVPIKSWFENYELFEPVFALYFSIACNPTKYLFDQLSFTNHFLNLAQAIESYHNKKYKDEGQYQTDEQYKLLKNKLTDYINTLPEEIIEGGFKSDLVNNGFNHLHKYSLRKRIKDLISKLEDVLPKEKAHDNEQSGKTILDKLTSVEATPEVRQKYLSFINDKKELKEFIQNVVLTRNYLTHLDETTQDVVTDAQKIHQLSRKLKFLLEICFLRNLKISEETIKNLILRNSTYSSI